MHLCYGDLHHKHFKDPADLATSVSMANRAQEASPRPINHVQMSVPRHRSDDANFAPLKNLRFGNGTVYAGLVHWSGRKLEVAGNIQAAFLRADRSRYGVRARPPAGGSVAKEIARDSSRCGGRNLTRRQSTPQSGDHFA
jgi:hypothetical protein